MVGLDVLHEGLHRAANAGLGERAHPAPGHFRLVPVVVVEEELAWGSGDGGVCGPGGGWALAALGSERAVWYFEF